MIQYRFWKDLSVEKYCRVLINLGHGSHGEMGTQSGRTASIGLDFGGIYPTLAGSWQCNTTLASKTRSPSSRFTSQQQSRELSQIS